MAPLIRQIRTLVYTHATPSPSAHGPLLTPRRWASVLRPLVAHDTVTNKTNKTSGCDAKRVLLHYSHLVAVKPGVLRTEIHSFMQRNVHCNVTSP